MQKLRASPRITQYMTLHPLFLTETELASITTLGVAAGSERERLDHVAIRVDGGRVEASATDRTVLAQLQFLPSAPATDWREPIGVRVSALRGFLADYRTAVPRRERDAAQPIAAVTAGGLTASGRAVPAGVTGIPSVAAPAVGAVSRLLARPHESALPASVTIAPAILAVLSKLRLPAPGARSIEVPAFTLTAIDLSTRSPLLHAAYDGEGGQTLRVILSTVDTAG